MARVSHTDSALSFHLMPPSGWLNDPNGLCQLHGTYHIFFQYSPYSAIGKGDKYWGHYETKDFINYTYTGIFLSPDCDLDKDGVYSGSAFVEDDTMYLYYTGNTMEDGDFDFTYEAPRLQYHAGHVKRRHYGFCQKMPFNKCRLPAHLILPCQGS